MGGNVRLHCAPRTDQKLTVVRCHICEALRNGKEWCRSRGLTTVSVEHVREPARGIQDLLALEAMGTRHTHAHTCTDIYAGRTPIHRKLFLKK